MRYLLILFTALSVAPATWSQECPPPDPAWESSTGCLKELGDVPLALHGTAESFGDGLELQQILDTYGQPALRRAWRAPDPSDPTRRTESQALSYSARRLVLTRPEGAERYQIEEFELRDPRTELPCGLAVRQPVETWSERLGIEAKDGAEHTLRWAKHWCGDGVWYGLSAEIVLGVSPEGRVTGVTWRYLSD